MSDADLLIKERDDEIERLQAEIKAVARERTILCEAKNAEIEQLKDARQVLSNALDTTRIEHQRMQNEIEQLHEALKVCRELKDGYRADLLRLRQSPNDSQPMSSGGPPQQ